MLANLVIAIEKRNWLLTNKRNAAQCKLNSQGLFVNRFQKSWTKFAMDCNRCGNDHIGNFPVP